MEDLDAPRSVQLVENCLYRVLDWNVATIETCSGRICIQWSQLTVGLRRRNIYEIRLPSIVCK